MIRVLVADDHAIVRDGLKQLLAAAGDVEVAGEASNEHEVLALLRQRDFDVVLLDMSMPGKSGVELIRQVHSEKPRLRILVLTMHEEHQYATRAIRAGARGYLTKDSAVRQLVEAIRKVAGGGAFISAEVATQLALAAMPGATAFPHEALSDRELQVFRLIAEGWSMSDIAGSLNLSVKTVSSHKANTMQKMGLSGTADIVRYAVAHKLVEDSSPI